MGKKKQISKNITSNANNFPKIKGKSARILENVLLSKSLSLEQRNKSLRNEYKLRHKTGSFIDRRFGEKESNNNNNGLASSSSLPTDDKFFERYKRETQRKYKKNMYQLDDNDDDKENLDESAHDLGGFVLTHKGIRIGDDSKRSSTNFDDDLSDFNDESDNDNQKGGQIDSQTVSLRHFGGFADDDNKNENEKTPHKRKSDVMKEIIAKSKFYKFERQKIKEENEDIRKELNDEFDSIRSSLLLENDKKENNYNNNTAQMLVKKEEEKNDLSNIKKSMQLDYDSLIHLLAADRKHAIATNRLKTPQELALAEKEKLERLEIERIQRMADNNIHLGGRDKPHPDENNEAEDSYDNFSSAIVSRASDNYTDLIPKCSENGTLLAAQQEFQGLDASIKSEDSKNGSEDTGDDEESESKDGNDNDEYDNEYGTEDGMDSDAFSDTCESDIVAIEVDESSDKRKNTINDSSQKKIENILSNDTDSVCNLIFTTEILLGLPFSFSCPSGHQQWMDCLSNTLSLPAANTIVDRIMTLYSVQLKKENSDSLEKFVTVLLDHIFFISSSPALRSQSLFKEYINDRIKNIERILEHLIPKSSLLELKNWFINRLSVLLRQCRTNGQVTMPKFEEMILFKIVGRLFSTSDFRHAVVSSYILLISFILHQSPLNSVADIISGLWLVDVFFSYQEKSHRYLSEVINYLLQCLLLYCPPCEESSVILSPNKTVFLPLREMFLKSCIEDKFSITLEEEFPISRIVEAYDPITDIHLDNMNKYWQSQILYWTISMIRRGLFQSKEQNYPALIEMFSPLYEVLQAVQRRFQTSNQVLLGFMKTCLAEICQTIEDFKKNRKPLCLQEFKPRSLPLLTPRIDKKPDNRFSKKGNGRFMAPLNDREEENRARRTYHHLQRSIKKEKKGAVKELRKDARYLNTLKKEADLERKSNKSNRVY